MSLCYERKLKAVDVFAVTSAAHKLSCRLSTKHSRNVMRVASYLVAFNSATEFNHVNDIRRRIVLDQMCRCNEATSDTGHGKTTIAILTVFTVVQLAARCHFCTHITLQQTKLQIIVDCNNVNKICSCTVHVYRSNQLTLQHRDMEHRQLKATEVSTVKWETLIMLQELLYSAMYKSSDTARLTC